MDLSTLIFQLVGQRTGIQSKLQKLLIPKPFQSHVLESPWRNLHPAANLWVWLYLIVHNGIAVQSFLLFLFMSLSMRPNWTVRLSKRRDWHEEIRKEFDDCIDSGESGSGVISTPSS